MAQWVYSIEQFQTGNDGEEQFFYVLVSEDLHRTGSPTGNLVLDGPLSEAEVRRRLLDAGFGAVEFDSAFANARERFRAKSQPQP